MLSLTITSENVSHPAQFIVITYMTHSHINNTSNSCPAFSQSRDEIKSLSLRVRAIPGYRLTKPQHRSGWNEMNEVRMKKVMERYLWNKKTGEFPRKTCPNSDSSTMNPTCSDRDTNSGPQNWKASALNCSAMEIPEIDTYQTTEIRGSDQNSEFFL